MELYTEERAAHMPDTLIAAIVCVDEKFLPALWESRGIDSVTVILGGDVALARQHAGTGDVVTAVTELHLERLGTNGTSNQLVAQANTKDRSSGLLQGLGQIVHSFREHRWVTRTVRHKQTVVVLAGKLGEIVVPRHNENLNTTSKQATQLVELHTNVQAKDTNRAARWVFECDILGGCEKARLTDRN